MKATGTDTIRILVMVIIMVLVLFVFYLFIASISGTRHPPSGTTQYTCEKTPAQSCETDCANSGKTSGSGTCESGKVCCR